MGLDSYFYFKGDEHRKIHTLKNAYSIHEWFTNKIPSKFWTEDIQEYELSEIDLHEFISALLHDEAIIHEMEYGSGFKEYLNDTLMLKETDRLDYSIYQEQYRYLSTALLKAQKQDLIICYGGSF